jgi:hypothetical protein
VPLFTPAVARHIIAVTAAAMMTCCPMLSQDSDTWLCVAASSHSRKCAS